MDRPPQEVMYKANIDAFCADLTRSLNLNQSVLLDVIRRCERSLGDDRNEPTLPVGTRQPYEKARPFRFGGTGKSKEDEHFSGVRTYTAFVESNNADTSDLSAAEPPRKVNLSPGKKRPHMSSNDAQTSSFSASSSAAPSSLPTEPSPKYQERDYGLFAVPERHLSDNKRPPHAASPRSASPRSTPPRSEPPRGVPLRDVLRGSMSMASEPGAEHPHITSHPLRKVLSTDRITEEHHRIWQGQQDQLRKHRRQRSTGSMSRSSSALSLNQRGQPKVPRISVQQATPSARTEDEPMFTFAGTAPSPSKASRDSGTPTIMEEKYPDTPKRMDSQQSTNATDTQSPSHRPVPMAGGLNTSFGGVGLDAGPTTPHLQRDPNQATFGEFREHDASNTESAASTSQASSTIPHADPLGATQRTKTYGPTAAAAAFLASQGLQPPPIGRPRSASAPQIQEMTTFARNKPVEMTVFRREDEDEEDSGAAAETKSADEDSEDTEFMVVEEVEDNEPLQVPHSRQPQPQSSATQPAPYTFGLSSAGGSSTAQATQDAAQTQDTQRFVELQSKIDEFVDTLMAELSARSSVPL